MALTYETVAAGGCLGGLQVRLVTMTSSTGAGGADYSSGFDLGSDSTKFGLNTILGCIGVSAAKAAGTTCSALLVFTWDAVAGKLRAWADFDTPTEESGSNLDAGATVQFLAFGV